MPTEALRSRVLILGCPGSGKSTLAGKLSQSTGLPLLGLDDHYWKPNWKRPNAETWTAMIDTLTGGAEWILDGNYQDSLSVRVSRANVAIVLDRSPMLCLSRVAWRGVLRLLGFTNSLPRSMRNAGSPRFSLDQRFVRKIVWFRRRELPALLNLLGEFAGAVDVHVLRSSRDVQRFLQVFPSPR